MKTQSKAKCDVSGLTLAELKDLQGKVAAALVEARSREKRELREKFAAEAARHGLTLDEVMGSVFAGAPKAARKPRKPSVQYRDPVSGVIWRGRGRMPEKFDRARAVALS